MRTSPRLPRRKRHRSNTYEPRCKNSRSNAEFDRRWIPAMISTSKFEPASQFADLGEHLIASIRGTRPGPTLLILGGIHGNEPAGVLAAERVLPRIQERSTDLRGEVVLLRGNT